MSRLRRLVGRLAVLGRRPFARGLLERRCLDGQPALFPDAARDGRALRERRLRTADG